MKFKIFNTAFFVFILGLAGEVVSQSNSPVTTTTTDDMSEKIPYIMLLILGVMVFWIFKALMFSDETETVEKKKWKFKISNLFMSINTEEEDEDLKNHSYDGIKELDNNLPPLLNYIFIASLIFSVIYVFHYHIFGSGDLPANEYNNEMVIAEMQRAELIKSGVFINENTVAKMTDESTLSKGKDIYLKNCVTCHGNNGEGLVGPNFADDYWIHGGSIKDLFVIIRDGVPAKGMISWKTQLNPKQMQDVANYILTFKGTNPPNAKAPEGVIYIDSTEIGKNDSLKTDSTKIK
ncbi:MAG TPA: cbb3-type cytochrome c oxidase N-terminal domain-containing protein [Ignavibacteria bacterium]|nr:cbb3-type cytochrome c oxidase N-terminal domain-containing protein [Ignavibacteria bacterium]